MIPIAMVLSFRRRVTVEGHAAGEPMAFLNLVMGDVGNSSQCETFSPSHAEPSR
jgi:hypothetical protein